MFFSEIHSIVIYENEELGLVAYYREKPELSHGVFKIFIQQLEIVENLKTILTDIVKKNGHLRHSERKARSCAVGWKISFFRMLTVKFQHPPTTCVCLFSFIKQFSIFPEFPKKTSLSTSST